MNEKKALTDIQKEFMDSDALNVERKATHESWFKDSTVDYWRHKRMYDTISAVAKHYVNATWVTIGDGRFGLDSVRLKKIFDLKKILPTDIAENMLRESMQRGHIDNYKVENAEHLSFSDDAFDVVFCKETFHHFPKPFAGLYEMLRVCREAVVLIEPSERIYTTVNSIDYIKSGFKLLFSKLLKNKYLPYLPKNYLVQHDYEEAGNYIYSVSIRELERLMHGMNLAGIAYKKFHDVYIKGCEFEESKPEQTILRQMKEVIKENEDLCKKYPQFYQPNMVTVVLFKYKVDGYLKTAMQTEGFQFLDKIENPYL